MLKINILLNIVLLIIISVSSCYYFDFNKEKNTYSLSKILPIIENIDSLKISLSSTKGNQVKKWSGDEDIIETILFFLKMSYNKKKSKDVVSFCEGDYWIEIFSKHSHILIKYNTINYLEAEVNNIKYNFHITNDFYFFILRPIFSQQN